MWLRSAATPGVPTISYRASWEISGLCLSSRDMGCPIPPAAPRTATLAWRYREETVMRSCTYVWSIARALCYFCVPHLCRSWEASCSLEIDEGSTYNECSGQHCVQKPCGTRYGCGDQPRDIHVLAWQPRCRRQGILGPEGRFQTAQRTSQHTTASKLWTDLVQRGRSSVSRQSSTTFLLRYACCRHCTA